MNKKLLQTFGNKEWRLNHLYSIVDKHANRITFNQNEIQRRISEHPNPRKMILKARQFGVSTGCLIEQFDFTITHRNVTSVILAHEQDGIKKLFRIIHRAYKYLPHKMMPVVDRGGGSKYELYFPLLNSRIYCDLDSRGDTIHNLHISEAAFIKDPDKVKATLQAVPIATGRVTIETTPNGMGNLFHEMWTDPDQPYAKLFFPWFIYPEYRIENIPIIRNEAEELLTAKIKKEFGIELSDAQLCFRRYKKKELGHLFEQEYPENDADCFLSSGQAAIDLKKVKEQMETRKHPIEERGYLKIYVKYDRKRRYVVGVDCAEGVDGDYSVATVYDARSREQVAVLRGQIKPHVFAEEIVNLCYRYSSDGKIPPLLGVERNNHGHAVLLALEHTHHYPNLYQHKDERLGWLTDKVTRPIMIDTFVEGVENSSVILNDSATLGECLTLVNDDGKIQAATGKHDDCVMASAIAIQMCLECASLDVYDDIKSKILI